ncbi:hypothetical protein BDZ94DRAFT_1227839 [Collybia nuda]|uniref:Uncharacterized protein n=1 Tax=Collybia nuda TaxID=64659 RepID=A0A9P5XVB0_9AGAR|nr:hypothetical protein BDZ94DRAFT_1227839 [Collybia nuda]
MARHREPLPRLNINPTLNMQQPMGMNYGGGQPMFSPALPTSLQQGFHPPYPMNGAMQTPMQSNFFPQPPSAPGRPTHHQGHASVAHLAAAGIHPPNGFPMTPLGGHFPRPSMMGISGHPSGNPFPNRNRRQLSIGGPPKAVLGGPARKHSPLPPAAANTPPPAAPQKVKRTNVKLPKETVLEDNGRLSSRPSWARTPLAPSEWVDREILPVDTTSAESFPPDDWRKHIPNTLDVFLPGKDIKQKAIEEKLEKLGVERGSGSSVPHIHAPHARAASISSPADPQLLLFKLNKLQQSQENSAFNSLTPSPNPMFGHLSSSPNQSSQGFVTNRHGHTMSLANMPMHPFFDPAATTTFDPFGPSVDVAVTPAMESIHAPQGRVPVAVSSLAPPAVSRPTSRPDFIRGFGLDIPEEEEEEEATVEVSADQNREDEEVLVGHEDADSGDASQDMDLDDSQVHPLQQPLDGTATASQSRIHSRHISKLSATLSIRSAGGLDDDFEEATEDLVPSVIVDPVEEEGDEEISHEDVDLEDVVAEWTGSEDLCIGSDGEDSIGEYSNPSDEERARQERLERRVRRRTSQQVDAPRRLPNFPRPPDNTMAIPLRLDDDMISNPSDEDYYSRPPSNMSGSGRPLPPLPHSRMDSGQHTIHDPAHAHSRTGSEQFTYPGHQQQQSSSSSAFAPRRDSLNPFAKPFVFGAPLDSSSWGQGSFSSAFSPPKAPLLTHSRLPSIGKPLNVAAPEFKPTGFTFRPPPGVPQMPAPPAGLDVPRPLPEVPSTDVSPFKVQGREKRQRRGSTASIEEGDSMTSFRFPPNPESPQSIRRAPVDSTSVNHQLNPSAEPFTFARFSAVSVLPYVPKASDPAVTDAPRVDSPEETLNDESTAKADNGEPQVAEFQLPSASKPKRTPIPLDFKHPVSSNTVPAGLFKALVNNGDDRTRRSVRSRLSSREIFEHIQRPSMDDFHVPTISRKVSRSRLVTDPGQRPSSPEDVFGTSRHNRRRSSLPDALHDDAVSLASENPSNSAMDLTNRMEMHQHERRIENMLEEGLSALRHDLRRETNGQHASTQAMISEIQSLFRTQLRESAARSIEDSQMDARGDLDFQLFRDVVEEGNKTLIITLKNDLHDLRQQVWQTRTSSNPGDITPIVEQMGTRTINAVVEAISELSARQEAINRVMPSRERDATVDNLMAVLTPVLSSLRTEPIDYEFLTNQLTQAVKPHISQLIDLASDKRETASLIVDRIMPLLPSRQAPVIDTDAITLQLTTEVRRAIAPIDAFEIKEQVADLVVERLDSRLAVRDKAFNVDSFSSKVVECITHLLDPFQKITGSIEQLVAAQEETGNQQSELVSNQEHIVDLVSGIPSQINNQLETLKTIQSDILVKLQEPPATVSERDDNVLQMKATMEEVSTTQKDLTLQTNELRSLHQHAVEKLDSLPGTLLAATTALQNNLSEFWSSQESLKREMDDLRKLNTDYQIQLTKARGAHGQVRVEKDVLNEKLSSTEADRDRLRGQFKELQTSNSEKMVQVSGLEIRNRELEEALAQALARLQASDVATQANQDRINDLEIANREIISEKQALKTKVDSLDLQVTFASRDKESALQALTTLQKQHDYLLSQQAHWDDLRQASEKIEMLTTLVSQADNEELKELRRSRDRSKVLEGEHAALQKRFREFETKVTNSEKASLTARQSLAQAQQRSSEWERRAKDCEGQLDLTQTKLDQAEQTHAQLDADYALVRLQLEEREADDRLAKTQQNQLRDQIAALESKVSRLQIELEQAKVSKPAVPAPYRNVTNGNIHQPPRPDSRASTVHEYRAVTPQMRLQSQSSSARSSTPPQPSVWDSMHAPTTNDTYKPRTSNGRYPNLGPTTPKARRPPQYFRPTMPSPTPSTVSLAPTQGDDGWWQ